jgi:hypothetical protein
MRMEKVACEFGQLTQPATATMCTPETVRHMHLPSTDVVCTVVQDVGVARGECAANASTCVSTQHDKKYKIIHTIPLLRERRPRMRPKRGGENVRTVDVAVRSRRDGEGVER